MNIQTIEADIDFLCGSTSATYSTANKIRNINIAYHDVARLIWESAGGWQYDDTNATTLPIAKTTLVHNQDDYSIPSTAQRIHEVHVQDHSGFWRKLKAFDVHDSGVAYPELYGGQPGLPLYYDLIGRSVRLIPQPHSAYVTLASGMALYVDRDVTEFATSATTTTPGFATAFHRILSYAASLDFLTDNTERQRLAEQRARLENGMSRFYSKRMVESQPTITPKSKRIWRRYL